MMFMITKQLAYQIVVILFIMIAMISVDGDDDETVTVAR